MRFFALKKKGGGEGKQKVDSRSSLYFSNCEESLFLCGSEILSGFILLLFSKTGFDTVA